MKPLNILIIILLFITNSSNIVAQDRNDISQTPMFKLLLKCEEQSFVDLKLSTKDDIGEYWNQIDNETLLKKDVYSYFQIRDYETPLQRNIFERTDTYNHLLDSIAILRKDFCKKKHAILISLYNCKPYDINTGTYTLEFDEYCLSSINGYIFCEGYNHFIKCKKLVTYSYRTYDGIDKWYQKKVSTKKIDENIALQIDKELLKGKKCAAKVLVIFNFDKVERVDSFGIFGSKEVIFCNTLEAYLVNVDTGQIYMNISDSFVTTNKR
ncbi:MAG: hypothetical protein WC679_10260 [Bacteroidales bacterium]|jgi:hypothetical protein